MRKKLFIMDIDGTLVVGGALLPGAAELISEIRMSGGRCCFFTNNSSRSIAEYQEQFRRWGIETTEPEFLTAGTYAIHWLKQKFPEQPIYVQGTASFLQECRREGLNVTEQPDADTAAVLSTYDRELTYEKLTKTCQALEQAHLPWYATNADAACPCEFGMVPDCAAICAMISRAVGRRPEYLGKPEAGMAEYALERFGCTREEALVIGDRLYTDIACGEQAGIETCLVLTGEEKGYSERPTYCLASVEQLARILRHMRISGEAEFPPEPFAGSGTNPAAQETPPKIPGLYQSEARWYKGDLHLHTTCSDGHNSPELLNLQAEQAGLDYYVVTDHNYWHETWPLSGCMVIPGTEITMDAGHMNVFHHGPFLLSLNHPYLSRWSWKLPQLVLAALDCLEIDNNPTFEYAPDVQAEEANRKAVRLSDLLWADGYRICAVGGSDLHLSEAERYGSSPEPARPGDPATFLYMDGLSADGFRDALKRCHAYVTRSCLVSFTCTIYDASDRELEGQWLFGDRLPEGACRMAYDFCISDVAAADRQVVSYVLVNGEKQVTGAAEHAHSELHCSGMLELPDTSYVWIRFGAEDERGRLVFYANPFTRGTGQEHRYRTFGDLPL